MSRFNLWRCMAILACVMGALGVVGSSGAAKPKFVPDITVYHGTYPYMGGHREVEAGVNTDGDDNHKKLTIGFSLYLPAACDNGEEASLPIKEGAALKGRTFAFHGKIPAAGELPGYDKYVTATIKGHFTSTKTFIVTFSARTAVEPNNPSPTFACTAAPVTVKMKEGPAPL